jgi:hypothetical protein
MVQKIFGSVVNWLRDSWLYIILVSAGLALFYLAYNLSRTNIWAVMAAGVAFGCMVALFVAARSRPIPAAPRPDVVTSLVTPTVLVNEIRSAALVSYGQIGTVTVKKERAKPDWRGLDRVFGEELVMDVGVRIVAGVNLKHLREEDVKVQDNAVEITLPPTKVLMVYVDESLTRVVQHKSGWLTGRDIGLMDTARREAMESMVAAAINKELFEKAGEQAAIAVASLARGLGFQQIKVTPTLPVIGQHYEELQDPSQIAKIIALPPEADAREDQQGD